MFRSLASPRHPRNLCLRAFLVLCLLGVLWKMSHQGLLNRKAHTSTLDYHIRKLYTLFQGHNVSKIGDAEEGYVSASLDTVLSDVTEKNDLADHGAEVEGHGVKLGRHAAEGSERAHVSDTANVTEAKRQQNDKPKQTATKGQDKPKQTATKGQDKPKQTVTKEQDKQKRTATKEQDKQKRTATKGQDKPKETAPKEQDKPKQTVPKEQDKPKQTAPKEQDKPKQTAPKEQDKPKQTVPKEQDKPKQTAPKEQDKPKQTAPKEQDKPKQTEPKEQDKPKETVSEGLDKPRAHLIPHWTDSPASSLCPPQPPALLGNMTMLPEASNFTEVVSLNPSLEPGGHYRPAECVARHRVAIIVPYRDREAHLLQLLHNLHPMLQRQQLDYFVLVIELAEPTTFNRGILMNIGAVEAVGLRDVQCFVFHDVDMIPENDKNMYSCPPMPLHLAATVDKWNYKLKWPYTFGGVSAFDRNQFWQINGFSNRYFGWGGEDDDLSRRFRSQGMKLTRHSLAVARYHMFKHGRDSGNKVNPNRRKMLNSWKKYQSRDGLNSLKYNVTKAELREGYTWLLVTVDKDTVMKDFPSL